MVERVTSKQDVEITNVDAQLLALAEAAPPFFLNRNLLSLYLRMIPGCIVPAVTLGFDSAMMNGLQAVDTWISYFDNPSGSILGLMTSILSLGAICATPFISPLGDRFGRRWGIWFGSAVMAVGGVIQGTSVHIAMFLVSRFLIGFGLVFANTYAPILIGELAHPRDRQVVTSLYQTSWYIGAIVAAWVTFGTFDMPSEWAWRIPSLLQSVPAFITLVGMFFMPESPRWLIANRRAEEAKQILVKFHANGQEGDAMVELEYAQMKLVIETDVATKTPWKALVATKGNRRRLLLMVMMGCFSQWSGNGLVSYYLVRVLETVGIASRKNQNVINGSLMIWNWFCATGSAFLTAKLRRRTQFLISTAGMLAIFASQTLCAGLFNEADNKAAGNTVIAMLFLFYTFYNLAWNALLYSYPVEVLPYPIRAKGFSVLMFCGKAANFINTFVNPIGLDAIGWKYYIVYVGWLVVETGCVWMFFVETKGPSLEAIAERFDRD
ncbi:general substrate transporter [Aspergillus karnatakaensis]|uniref:general substrate transporter n=1 Tax=Aspergillus karnatakaensis TaxID=1810916 RepID=UPI003CCDD29B